MPKQKLELELNNFVEQMSLLLDLNLQDKYRTGVVENLQRIYVQARLVNEFELPEQIEISSKFEP